MLKDVRPPHLRPISFNFMHFLPENRMCAPPFVTKQRPPPFGKSWIRHCLSRSKSREQKIRPSELNSRSLARGNMENAKPNVSNVRSDRIKIDFTGGSQNNTPVKDRGRVRQHTARDEESHKPNPDEIIVSVQASEDDFSSDDEIIDEVEMEQEQIYPVDEDVADNVQVMRTDRRYVVGKGLCSAVDADNVLNSIPAEVEKLTEKVVNYVSVLDGSSAETIRPIDVQQIRSDPIFKEMLSQAVAEQIKIDRSAANGSQRAANEIVSAGRMDVVDSDARMNVSCGEGLVTNTHELNDQPNFQT